MTLDDILTLTKAGFTADQINTMIKASEEKPKAETKAEAESEAKAEAEAEAKAEAPEDVNAAIIKSISDLNVKIEEISKNMVAPAMPSLNNVKPLGMDDIIKKFFEEG